MSKRTGGLHFLARRVLRHSLQHVGQHVAMFMLNNVAEFGLRLTARTIFSKLYSHHVTSIAESEVLARPNMQTCALSPSEEHSA